MLNAAAYFCRDHRAAARFQELRAQSREAAYALGLAVVYAGLGVALDRRPEQRSVRRGAPAADHALRVGDHVSDHRDCAPSCTSTGLRWPGWWKARWCSGLEPERSTAG